MEGTYAKSISIPPRYGTNKWLREGTLKGVKLFQFLQGTVQTKTGIPT